MITFSVIDLGILLSVIIYCIEFSEAKCEQAFPQISV